MYCITLQSMILDVISKVAFRTGVVEPMLLELFSKTKCQIVATVDDNSGVGDKGAMRRSRIWKAQANSYTWTFSADSSNAPMPPPDAPLSPTRSHRKTEEIIIPAKINFKMGEDFLVTIPISGEKVNVSTFRYFLCFNYNRHLI